MESLNGKKIYDISMEIKEGMPLYPGDFDLKIEQKKHFHIDGYNLTTMAIGVHTGTHIDAPLHFIDKAKSVDKLTLDRFIAKVQVVEIKDTKAITVKELKTIDIKEKNIIFKTANSFVDVFNKDYVALTREGAKYLIEKKLNLIGIDCLSIEAYDSLGHPVHKALLGEEIIILEGLRLKNIKPGIYTLLALPLNIIASEGSQVRAVLLS